MFAGLRDINRMIHITVDPILQTLGGRFINENDKVEKMAQFFEEQAIHQHNIHLLIIAHGDQLCAQMQPRFIDRVLIANIHSKEELLTKLWLLVRLLLKDESVASRIRGLAAMLAQFQNRITITCKKDGETCPLSMEEHRRFIEKMGETIANEVWLQAEKLPTYVAILKEANFRESHGEFIATNLTVIVDERECKRVEFHRAKNLTPH